MSYPIHTSPLPSYTGLPPPSYTLGRASQSTLLDLLHLLDLLDLLDRLTPTHLLDLSDLPPIPPYHTYTLTMASSRPFREG